MLIKVSIPFKRESIYKVGVTQGGSSANWYGFNSLQTGKHIQSTEGQNRVRHEGDRFQFPSNGKAYTKTK